MEKIAIRPFHEKYPFAKKRQAVIPTITTFYPSPTCINFPPRSSIIVPFPLLLLLLFGQLPSGEDNGCKRRGKQQCFFVFLLHSPHVRRKGIAIPPTTIFFATTQKKKRREPPLLQTPVAPSIVRPMKSVLQFPLRLFQCKPSTTLRRLHVTTASVRRPYKLISPSSPSLLPFCSHGGQER